MTFFPFLLCYYETKSVSFWVSSQKIITANNWKNVAFDRLLASDMTEYGEMPGQIQMISDKFLKYYKINKELIV